MAALLTVAVPFPPSTNTYYRHFRGRMVISAKGRAYKATVARLLASEGIQPVPGRVDVEVRLTAPDRRVRDLDNFAGKALFDALKGIAFGDDSEVYVSSARWNLDKDGNIAVEKGKGGALVTVSALQ